MAINGGMPNFLTAPLVDNGMGDLIGNALNAYTASMQARQAPRKFETEQTGRELANDLSKESIIKNRYENQYLPTKLEQEQQSRQNELNYQPQTLEAKLQEILGGNQLNRERIEAAQLENKKAKKAHDIFDKMTSGDMGAKDWDDAWRNPLTRQALIDAGHKLPSKYENEEKNNTKAMSEINEQLPVLYELRSNWDTADALIHQPGSKSATGNQFLVGSPMFSKKETIELRSALETVFGQLVVGMSGQFKGAFRQGEQSLLENIKPSIGNTQSQIKSKIRIGRQMTETGIKRLELQAKYMHEDSMPAHEAMARAQQETGDMAKKFDFHKSGREQKREDKKLEKEQKIEKLRNPANDVVQVINNKNAVNEKIKAANIPEQDIQEIKSMSAQDIERISNYTFSNYSKAKQALILQRAEELERGGR